MKEINVQSMSDIITNSSSEVFVIQSDKTWKEVEDLMKQWGLEDGWSGMGGCIEVYDSKRPYADKYTSEMYKKEPFCPWVPKGHLLVHIDWSMKNHIEKMFEDFNVVDSDYIDLVVDHKTGKTRKATPDDFRGLGPDEEYLPAGFNLINGAKKAYAEKKAKALEKEMSEISDIETFKKYYKTYADWQEALYTIEDCAIDNEDLEKMWKENNKRKEEPKKMNNGKNTINK